MLEKNYPFTFIVQENQGQSGARNNGINHAKGRIILFIDDDVLAHPALVKTHIRLQQGQDNLIVRGPVINIPSLKIPVDRPVGFWDMSKNFFCTSNASVSKKHIIDAGMFDVDFRWWEDADLGFRLRMKGLGWKYSLQAVTYHYKPPVENEFLYTKKLSITMGKYAVKLYRKHPHWRIKLATGINKLDFFKSSLLNNEFLMNFYEKLITSEGKSKQYLSSLLIPSLAKYYYFKTIKEELEKV